MTRELKFRVLYDLPTLEDKHNKVPYTPYWHYFEVCSTIDWFRCENAEKTIGQYTGLKDKNGVEIYEDDIAQGKSGSGVVDYSERGTRFGIHTTKPHYICGTPVSKYYSLIGCEVIGNIHENPQLLK